MLLFVHLNAVDEEAYASRLRHLIGPENVVVRGDRFEPAAVTYALGWKPEPNAFEGLVNLKAVLSYGAGVDGIVTSAVPPEVPIVRFVDPDLRQRMREYVVANVGMHHRLHSFFAAAQRDKKWRDICPPRADEICVGVMGLGQLGQTVLAALGPLGYQLAGWSRSLKTLEDVACFAGRDGLREFLSRTDILVCLLPLTNETRGILDQNLFSALRRGPLHGGPAVINAARGGHLVETDLVAALKDGTLGAASLDVFDPEPLPETSPLWELTNCMITPHIAAVSNPDAMTAYFADVIRRSEAGEPLRNVVDRERGY